MKIFTIGHSTRPIALFLDLVRQADINFLVDVRRFPVSQRMPQFNGGPLAKSLQQADIGYVHCEALGGRRLPRAGSQASRNMLWPEGGFRNYADYAETFCFRQALEKLLALAQTKTVCIMCAEADWKNCHRRIITDYLLASGVDVRHIFGDHIETAQLTEGATVIAHGRLGYNDLPLFA